MKVEIAYAANHSPPCLLEVDVPQVCSLGQAITHSGILETFPEIDLNVHLVGIWAQKKPLTTPLSAGDRVEIYRPLLLSPTEARRLRAQRAKDAQ